MKILYIITGLALGGAERITVDLANEMAIRGHDVLIVYLNGENVFQNQIQHSICVKKILVTKEPINFMKSLIKARRVLKRFRPDVVHAQMFHANVFARLLRCIVSIPLLICTEHSKNIESNVRMVIYQITDFLSNVNTNVSQEATEYFIEKNAFSASKSCFVYNGINLKYFKKITNKKSYIREKYGIAEDDFVFLNVGRLVLAKDHINLLNAFLTFHAKYKKGRLLIVGNGPLLHILETYVAKEDLTECVLFAGAHDNVLDFYNAADCFVLSSSWEGFGLVLAEAMGCELPVISTNAGGCAEVVGDSDFIVPTNSSNALASKMEEIFALPIEKRMLIGKNNRVKVEKFDISNIATQWLRIYEFGIPI